MSHPEDSEAVLMTVCQVPPKLGGIDRCVPNRCDQRTSVKMMTEQFWLNRNSITASLLEILGNAQDLSEVGS